MRLSILIPVLNESQRLAQAVERAFSLSEEGIHVVEVIVIDGGSHDDSCKVASEAGATVLQAEAGRGQQLALGARAAQGDVILMLHADNWLEPKASEQIRSALENKQIEAGAFRQRIEAYGFRYRALEWGNALRVQWFGLPYGDQAIFVRRSVLEAIGGIPEIKLMEDVALMRKLKCRRRPCLLPGPLHVSARRWQQNGVVRQTLRNWFLLTAFTLGCPAETIARWYQPEEEF